MGTRKQTEVPHPSIGRWFLKHFPRRLGTRFTESEGERCGGAILAADEASSCFCHKVRPLFQGTQGPPVPLRASGPGDPEHSFRPTRHC